MIENVWVLTLLKYVAKLYPILVEKPLGTSFLLGWDTNIHVPSCYEFSVLFKAVHYMSYYILLVKIE